MTARIDEACGEEKTLKTGLRSETMRRKMESFVVSCAGNMVHLECVGDFLFQENKQIHCTPGWLQAGDRQ